MTIKNILCPHCYRKFATQTALNNHLRDTANKVPCKFCQKLFNGGQMKQHFVDKHFDLLDEHKFMCKYCEKKFSEEKYLDKHLSKSFYCCEKSELQERIKNRHVVRCCGFCSTVEYYCDKFGFFGGCNC